jgi:serine protease Do
VQKGQAGDVAGLKENDVILSVDGKDVDQSNELQSTIGMHHAGDKVMLRIWRDGKEIDKSVTLKPRTDMDDKVSVNTEDEEQPAETASKSTATLDNIGLTVQTVTDEQKDKYHVSNGVIITGEAMASEAMDRGIPRGNAVITEAAHHKVKSAGDFEDIINANKGKAVGLTIVDDKGDSHFFAIRVPND